MSNGLVESLSGGELQPYSPGESLAPVDSWTQNDDVDLLHERQHAPHKITFFGTPLAAGVTEQHVAATLNELSTLFVNDMGALHYPANLIGFAAKYFMESALKPPRQVRAIHNFELPSELASDWMANDFCNCLENIKPGTKREKQQFLTAAITWLAKLAKHVSQTPDAGRGALSTRTSPSSSEAMLNSLSDADYNKVLKINEQALARTMQVLQRRWGDYTYQQNIQIAQDYLNHLPEADQRHFDQFTTVNGVNWVHLRNTPEFIIAMFDAATGAHSIPKDGPGIAREIASIENCIKHERAKYLKDPQLQARLRTLYDLRDRR
jgi:hypothetical protein